MPNDPSPLPARRTVTSETIEVLHNRVSVRKYSDKPVDDATIDAVLEAAFRAPTSSNIQAYTVVLVRDPETKKQLSVPTGNQRHVAEAPVFLAFCADITRIEEALKRNGKSIDDNNMELGLVSSIDAALVGMSAYLAADSLGLKGVMIGAVRNDPIAISRILGLPRRVYCVYGMCLGWPDQAPPQKPRMDYSSMVHRERYDPDAALGALDAYDAELAAHYQSKGVKTTPDSWTHDIAEKFFPPRREKLRAQLKQLGFDFR